MNYTIKKMLRLFELYKLNCFSLLAKLPSAISLLDTKYNFECSLGHS